MATSTDTGPQPDPAPQPAGVAQLSRFQMRPRSYTAEEWALRDQIVTKAQELERLYGKLPASRYHSLALTALEESVMWAHEGLRR